MARQTQPTARPVQKVWIYGSDEGALNSGNTNSAPTQVTSKIQPVGDHTTNSSLSSAVTLTPPNDDVNALMFGVEDQSVRMRFDGSDADANTGFKFLAGDLVEIQFTPGIRFSFIETAASATLQYQWGIIQ